MRKGMAALLTCAILAGFVSSAGAETSGDSETVSFSIPGNQWRIGLDTIFAGRMKRSENGAPKYLYGITAGLGFGYRYYFTVNDELQTVHPYIEGGTNKLIYPYVGGGIEYGFPSGNDLTGAESAFSIGGGLYVFSEFYGMDTVVFPVITLSYSFR